jgi:hypothetical protein
LRERKREGNEKVRDGKFKRANETEREKGLRERKIERGK